MGEIKITDELFIALVKFFLAGDDTLYDQCRDGIRDKFERALNRDLYSKMHDANLSDAERERARAEYLDRRGIPHDFRW